MKSDIVPPELLRSSSAFVTPASPCGAKTSCYQVGVSTRQQ
jgi:hypothetical protein